MTTPFRIATYNVEWFSSLFSRDDKLLDDNKWSTRYKTTRSQQIEAIAKVLTAVDADAILIVEAPNSGKRQSSTRALEGFAGVFNLRTNRALEGFANDTRQEITLLYDPAVCRAKHDPQGGVPDHSNPHDAPRFDSSFQIDLGVDGNHEKVNFSKPPLEVELHPIGAKPIRLIGVHVKSKAPHGAKSPNEVAQISTANRRKQLAQSIWLRRRIDAHVTAGDAIVVAGDLNDGPGLDEYEQILGRSSVEVVMGVGGDKARQLFDPHAIAAMKPQIDNPPATSRFYIKPKRAYLNALLDYIMVSPDLHARAKGWEIWHPFDNAACFKDRALHKALLTASDHFPVSLDLNL